MMIPMLGMPKTELTMNVKYEIRLFGLQGRKLKIYIKIVIISNVF